MTTTTVRAALGRQVDLRALLRRDALRLLYVATWVVALWAVRVVMVSPLGFDAHCYWAALHRPSLYTTGPMTGDAYLYSPAFAWAIWPLGQLPFPVIAILFGAIEAVLLVWLLRPLGWWWMAPLMLIGLLDIAAGNVFVLIAAVCVLGFRHPGAWAFPLLTKITPGLGPVWFLVRREWRQLWISLGVTLAVIVVSAAIAPHLWIEWVRFLLANSGSSTRHFTGTILPPFIYRAPVGLALLVWGARRGKRWTLPVAMLLCTPMTWLGSFVLLASIPRLTRHPIPAR